MILVKRKQTAPPDFEPDAYVILELLINADSCLQKAADSAIEAKAFTLSAELKRVSCRIVERIFSLMHERKLVAGLMSPAAQNLFKEFVERSGGRKW